MNVARFLELPLMGILRGIDRSLIDPLFSAVIEAGLETIEITMNTEDACGLIKEAAEKYGNRINIGAGTVLTIRDLYRAVDAGARFIVSPVMDKKIVKYCVKRSLPVFPGAFTPQEILTAWDRGATMVKVFPAGLLGPAYLKQLKGPFDKVRLMAVGGITLDNMNEYFISGARAVAFGSSVFRRTLLGSGSFGTIKTLVSEYVGKARSIAALLEK
jgi:2-dehydro-3-deoxyphosphogluconate aldolase/(4S)-4-hydroxy-2-oxoglutarate aldolase